MDYMQRRIRQIRYQDIEEIGGDLLVSLSRISSLFIQNNDILILKQQHFIDEMLSSLFRY